MKEPEYCVICHEETCEDYDSCRIEWLAQCEQDHKDFVADMEDSEIGRRMAGEPEITKVIGHVREEPSFPKVQLRRRNK